MPKVAVYGMYAGSTLMGPSNQIATLIIVRRLSADGSSTTDVATFPAPPAPGRTYAPYVLARGRVARDADGSTVSMELRATGYGLNPSVLMGSSRWERVPQKDDPEKPETTKPRTLKVDMDNVFVGRRGDTVANDALYSLGMVEALTYRDDVVTWRVPSIGGTRKVFAGDRAPTTYTQYRVQPSHEGVYWFANRPMRLRVCPIARDGAPDTIKVNGMPATTNIRAVALYDPQGELVGLGSCFGHSEDIESVEAGGKSGEVAYEHPQAPTAPTPFPLALYPGISGCIALQKPTPSEEATYLRAMG